MMSAEMIVLSVDPGGHAWPGGGFPRAVAEKPAAAASRRSLPAVPSSIAVFALERCVVGRSRRWRPIVELVSPARLPTSLRSLVSADRPSRRRDKQSRRGGRAVRWSR